MMWNPCSGKERREGKREGRKELSNDIWEKYIRNIHDKGLIYLIYTELKLKSQKEKKGRWRKADEKHNRKKRMK